jgi:hypothetical protein
MGNSFHCKKAKAGATHPRRAAVIAAEASAEESRRKGFFSLLT